MEKLIDEKETDEKKENNKAIDQEEQPNIEVTEINENDESERKTVKKAKKKTKKDDKEKLKIQIKELEEKNLRTQAELINYRKRKEEEISRMLKYANEDLVKEILPLLDNFERAIKMDDEDLEDEVSKFLAGFKMIYVDFKNMLEKYEIIAIDGNNKPFNPVYHQAVMTTKVEATEPGMVLEVLQKGYLLKDRVIRPAMVRVSE